MASVYVMSSHPFPEVDAFVADCIGRYSLDLHRYALPMRKAFEQYLREYPEVKAVFVGTRRTDPHGEGLRHFDPTDHGWPAFMRVHPVIDWHYQEVWAVSFLQPPQGERETEIEGPGTKADMRGEI
jgi:FAD synthetase